MTRLVTQGDVDVAEILLTVNKPEDEVIAALVYRGLAQDAAATLVDIAKHRITYPVVFDNGRIEVIRPTKSISGQD